MYRKSERFIWTRQKHGLRCDVYAGTELKRLLAEWPLRIQDFPGCSCHNIETKMNGMGLGWCESKDGMDEIVASMKESAARRGLPFLDAAARLLVKRAIHNARKAEAKRAKEAEAAAAEGRPA